MQGKILNPQDPRVIKTKKQFLSAFKELFLLYDDYMSITVKELCDKANLNRKTFYLHYKQVDDLLIEIQNEYIQGLYERIKDLDFFNDAEAVVRAQFEMNESNPVYKKVSTSSIYFHTKEMGKKKLFDYLVEKGKVLKVTEDTATFVDIIYHYYEMTIYIMYKRWVIKNYPIAKEEMIALTAKLIKQGISFYK